MSKQEKKALVPELRFPEFRDAGEWKQRPIGTRVDLLSGFPFKSAEISEDVTGVPLMRGINITEGRIRHSKDMDRFFLGETEKLEKYRLQVNDLVIGMDGSKVGKNSALITKEDANSLLIQRVARLRANCSSTISFIFQHIHSNSFHNYVDRINTSGGIPHISSKQINEFEICFPPIESEQRKIADCLSSIDELITAQNQKLDALKAHKNGLMQKLFPAEGETVPKLRFPEFRDAGEWKNNTFGGVATFFNGRAYKQTELLEKGKYRVLRVGNFFSNNEWYFSNLELDENKYCDEGDLLYAWSASFGPRIWKGEKVIYHYHIWKVVNNECVDKQFLFILLDFETKRMKAASANGLGLLHITKGAIEGWRCLLPGKDEQQKIADCLSAIDDLIAAQAQKIESLKAHKKGLMQQLFPSVEQLGP